MIPAFWSELPEIIDEMSDSGRVRCVVISSTGKHFSAGMDLSVFTGGDVLTEGSDGASGGDSNEVGRQRANLRTNAMHLQRSFSALEEARMPVLVAIQGGAVGGAVDMVTAADCRYATEDAWFCIQEINIGMTADVGTLQRLPKLIPDGVVRELAYTGDRMPAQRAKEGARQRGVRRPGHHARERARYRRPYRLEVTARGLRLKQSIVYARDHSVADSLNQIATWQTGMFQPRDMMESFQAQMEKREPEFDDLNPVRRGLA